MIGSRPARSMPTWSWITHTVEIGANYILFPIASFPTPLHHEAIDRVTVWRLKQEFNRNGRADPWLKATKHRIGKGTSPRPVLNCSISSPRRLLDRRSFPGPTVFCSPCAQSELRAADLPSAAMGLANAGSIVHRARMDLAESVLPVPLVQIVENMEN